MEDNIPSHPCLELMANSEQVLTKRIGRRLITMEKKSLYQVNRISYLNLLVEVRVELCILPNLDVDLDQGLESTPNIVVAQGLDI